MNRPGQHIPNGYSYLAMAFAGLVERLNLCARARGAAHHGDHLHPDCPVIRTDAVKLKPLFVLLPLIAALVPGLRAQPASATFRPTLVDEFSASYTDSGKGGLDRGAASVGDIALSRFEFSTSGRVPLNEGMVFIPGLAYSRTTLDASPGVALPGTLQELTLDLGLRGLFSRQWAYLAGLRPGFYGDFKHLDGSSFNAPLFLAVFYVPNPTLTWTMGIAANAFNQHPVLPVVGVQWKFAPDWQLDVGFPRTGVNYRVDDSLKLRAGLSVLGGNYRITENLGVPAPGIARLANTTLDLTEIRVGVGLVYQFKGGPELEADAGLTTQRHFDYPDRNYRLRGDNVGWLSLALRQKF
jgi:hypothetical protein